MCTMQAMWFVLVPYIASILRLGGGYACNDRNRLMRNTGWLQDPKTKNTKRFHRDTKSWVRYPKVFIDSGRPLPNEHALLKSRSYVDIGDAKEEWTRLRNEGWQQVSPQWGEDLDV